MTKRQAREWVHQQLILDELDSNQLVAAFTVLTSRRPDAADRQNGLFRRCLEIVLGAASAGPPMPVTAPQRR